MSKLRVQAPQDLVAGASLIAISLFALWAGSALSSGSPGAPGPGLFPRALASMIGLGGVLLVLVSFLREGERLVRWAWRGPLMISIAALSFAFTLRSLGLVVAGPLVILISGAASPETRWRELAIFAVILTVVCVVLFRYLLRLAIPILTIPGVVTL